MEYRLLTPVYQVSDSRFSTYWRSRRDSFHANLNTVPQRQRRPKGWQKPAEVRLPTLGTTLGGAQQETPVNILVIHEILACMQASWYIKCVP
ncbi:hypothetical protein EBZ38_16640, partial [bacterium]|nr:hypothetical protein [bacterium]